MSREPSLSAIIPIRNRSGVRLTNCLRSLRWQENIDHQEVEIVVVDFGSDESHRLKIIEDCAPFQVKIERVEVEGLWSRSKALNHGLRVASGAYLFCTDVDMIFSPLFLSKMLEVHQEAEVERSSDDSKRGVIIFSRCHDLPETTPLASWHRDEYESLLSNSHLRSTQGTGACQSTHRQFFFEVRGYDEMFQHWGAEDDDMRCRALRYGLKPHWISPEVTMLHQWHPTSKNEHPWRRRFNKWYLYLTRWKIKKNSKEWGGRP